MGNFPLNVQEILERHCENNSRLLELLTEHSSKVADKALEIAGKVAHFFPDQNFIFEAAMLHDIGICEVNAPDIFCYGSEPYLRHGLAGRRLLESIGLDRHALVCERHIGAGLTAKEIESANLPLPHRDMLPLTLEEIIVCVADKYYSKSHPGTEKDMLHICDSLQKHGSAPLKRFKQWCRQLGIET